MTFMVGSTNPSKINAVKLAVATQWPQAEVIGVESKSGVRHQPMSDAETRKGARNRAQAALNMGAEKENEVGVGLEGGVFFRGRHKEMWATVWCAVIDQNGAVFEANGARLKVPKVIAQKILAGTEMGEVVAELTKVKNVKQKEGMIGFITQHVTNRGEEYAAIAKLAIGLWYGRNWERHLPTSY